MLPFIYRPPSNRWLGSLTSVFNMCLMGVYNVDKEKPYRQGQPKNSCVQGPQTNRGQAALPCLQLQIFQIISKINLNLNNSNVNRFWLKTLTILLLLPTCLQSSHCLLRIGGAMRQPVFTR